MNKLLLFITLGVSQIVFSQTGNIGINTTSPTHTLDVNGNTRVRTLTLPSQYNQENIVVADNNGVLKTALRSDIAPVPNKVGTVISDGTKLIVAQEIVALMSTDYTTTSGTPSVINTVNKKIIDNDNTLNNGTFTVTNNGVYQIIMNGQINCNVNNRLIFGLWDNTANRWIARTNDSYTAPIDSNSLQTYTLITTVEMSTGSTYSFRAATPTGGSNESVTIKAQSSGTTGSGDVSYFSVKRIK